MKILDFISDIGLQREINEDSYLIDKKNNFAIVSDGMGGHEKGDIASKLIIKSFLHEISDISQDTINDDLTFQSIMFKHLNNANEYSSSKLIEYANKNNIFNTIGATVAGILMCENINKVALFHLGDSRIYRIRDNEIDLLTIDHTNNTQNKNVLSKAIGNFEVFDLDINFLEYTQNDKFLLCTDGISNFLNDDELLDVFTKNKKDYCDIIKNKIYIKGAKDNLTLIIVEAG